MAVDEEVQAFLAAGVITPQEADALTQAALKSPCGEKSGKK
jgi:hypothetical protein